LTDLNGGARLDWKWGPDKGKRDGETEFRGTRGHRRVGAHWQRRSIGRRV
jgi:hypothetical protein